MPSVNSFAVLLQKKKKIKEKMCLDLEGGWEEEQGFGNANMGRLLEMFKEKYEFKITWTWMYSCINKGSLGF